MSALLQSDYDHYRLRNGHRSLLTCISSGKSFVVKQDLDEKVVLVGVGNLEVCEVSPAEFKSNFVCYKQPKGVRG